MLLSSLPRRVAFLSSCPCFWLRGTRFSTTVPNLLAFEKRIHGGVANIPDISQSVSLQRTIGHDIDTAGRALGPSKTESYLSSLLADGATPTLQDLERLKPPGHSNPQSRQYAREYSTLLNTLCRSFSHDQLRCFSQQYGLHIGSNQRKMSVAGTIVEKAWRWPSLKELKRAQRDRTEVTSQTLAITSSELFILLGKGLPLRSCATLTDAILRRFRLVSVIEDIQCVHFCETQPSLFIFRRKSRVCQGNGEICWQR